MELKTVLAYPLRSYLSLRSLSFLAEFQTLNRLSQMIPGTKERTIEKDPELLKSMLADIQDLFQRDAENMIGGLYPLQVLKPEPVLDHIRRLPGLLWDGIKINRRRKLKGSKDFSKATTPLLEEMPDYYRRNFHFQSDGYLSKDSARYYDHQVELLFLGSADSMRRMCLGPIKRRLNADDGHGLRILELACGTGRTTRFLRMAFPKAKITAVDLSPAYLKVAQENLRDLDRIDFVEGDASNLNFKDSSFDVVVSVYLFHELPKDVRRQVFHEARRLVRPGGWVVTVDSIQAGDKPEYDRALQHFPIDFHEPFYKNYTEDPLRNIYDEVGLNVIDEDRGFLSKMIAGQKI